MTRTPADDESRRQFGGRRVRQRQEHQVGVARERARDRAARSSRSTDPFSAGSRRAAVAPDDVAAVIVTRGMPREQPQQLLTGVAGRAGDRHPRAGPAAAV